MSANPDELYEAIESLVRRHKPFTLDRFGSMANTHMDLTGTWKCPSPYGFMKLDAYEYAKAVGPRYMADVFVNCEQVWYLEDSLRSVFFDSQHLRWLCYSEATIPAFRTKAEAVCSNTFRERVLLLGRTIASELQSGELVVDRVAEWLACNKRHNSRFPEYEEDDLCRTMLILRRSTPLARRRSLNLRGRRRRRSQNRTVAESTLRYEVVPEYLYSRRGYDHRPPAVRDGRGESG